MQRSDQTRTVTETQVILSPEDVLEACRQFAQKQYNLGACIYNNVAAGVTLVFTGPPEDPTAPRAAQLIEKIRRRNALPQP